ncbi:hypothetical protein BGZ54_001233 [Gamsiella multidivaricata]|nr:hypothetical protein BGZ54_001233 [Gamsiella multidivaricata]
MVSHAAAHEDDEPLLPLVDRDDDLPTGSSKQKQHQRHKQQQDEIVKSSKLSGSTVHDSISTSLSGPEDPEHRHHHHPHKDSAKRLSISSECGHDHSHDQPPSFSDDGEDEPMLLETQKESERDKKRLKIAIGLCGTFFVIELLGGLWSDSLALLSDSFHLLTDITSFIISLAAIYLSQRSSTATHTFGYHRAEVLGALFSIFLIWGLTLMLVVEAYDRVRYPVDIDGKTMSVVAALGVFVNILLIHATHQDHVPLQSEDDHDLALDGTTHKTVPSQEHDHSHDHQHGHSGHDHHHHHHVSLNITAATLHVLGDLLSSIGVLISSLVITFFPSLTYLDPVCTFVFSILVIATTIGVFRRSISILMESVPRGIDSEEVREAICDIPGILEVKSLRIWSLTIGRVALAATVYLQPEVRDLRRAASIVASARRMIRTRYGIKECTVQVEVYTMHAAQSQSSHMRIVDPARAKTAAPDNSSHSHLPMDTLARHDQDIIFSIGDEDLDETIAHKQGSHTHSHLLSYQITRAGTPLDQYRGNRHASDDDESETEMEQETSPPTEHNQWA